MIRQVRRFVVFLLRALEALAMHMGRRPWKIEKFNRLIGKDVEAALDVIGRARVVVGIPFHKESGNIAALVAKTQRDLEQHGGPAAIVIAGERRTRNILLDTALPASTANVKVFAFFKPFGFAQRPGLSRRSWSHWAILQIASRLQADVIFIDADVRNSEGWVQRYLAAIQGGGADVAVANYVRSFNADDAIVHIWDRLVFGTVFRKWIAFRHGGDYAISRRLLPGILADPAIMRERAYTMDSAVMAHATRHSGRIEPVWMRTKEHEPITPANLFSRLPQLVHSVFDDVALHLPVILALPRKPAPPIPLRESEIAGRMSELVSPGFRNALHADLGVRFRATSEDIRRSVGTACFAEYAAAAGAATADAVDITPREWARATLRILARYVRSRDPLKKARLANACVPILEAGILGFLNRTNDMHYDEAFAYLDSEYVPAFQKRWNALSRRLVVYRLALLRRWPVRMARQFGRHLVLSSGR